MRIVFLSTNDNLGGAATVTLRLVEGLRILGEDVAMVSARRTLSKEWRYVSYVNRLRWGVAFLRERLGIFLRNGFSRRRLFQVSTASAGCRLSNLPAVKEADVIVLNWVNQGFCSLDDVDRLCSLGKPVIWIMHDLWCATGICHLPAECKRYHSQCGCCPLLGNADKPQCATDLSHRVWEQKRALYARYSNLHFVAVSQWQSDMAQKGPLLHDRSISILPHAFPVNTYNISVNSAQLAELRTFGIDTNKLLLVMVAARLDDPVKDLPLAIKSLNALVEGAPAVAEMCQAVFVGQLRDKSLLDDLKFNHVHTGPMTQDQLRSLYATTAVVMSTSDYETMGATLMEGIASGATAVTFGVGGQTEIVTHCENGFIAEYKNYEHFALCLHEAILRPFDRQEQHTSVALRFSDEAIAQRFMDIVNYELDGNGY